MGTAILAWALKNWQLIVVVAFVGALVGYIETLRLEVDHYKSEVVAQQLAIDAAVDKQNRAEALAKQRANEITKEHESALKDHNDLVDKNTKLVQENINANEELKRTKLSLNLVQLWNSSKQPSDAAPTAVKGNAPEASRPQAAAPAVTLQDLFRVSAENDANHLKCVKQVTEWQDFWAEYVKAKEAADAITRGRAD